jgi:Flp pilus assembly protein TadD
LLAQSDNVPVLIHLGGFKSRREKIPPAGSSFTVSADGLRHPLPPKVVKALAEAQRHTGAGRLAEASSELHKIVAHNPNVWQARLNLGVVEMKLGLANEALASFTRARELEPRSSKAALDSAIALVALRRVGEAESAARDALKLDPSNHNAQELLDLLQTGRERGYIKTPAAPE